MTLLNLYRITVITVPALIVVAAMLQNAVDPRLLMLDAMVAAEESGACCKTYYGLISTFGILVWMSTAAICGFAAWLLHRTKSEPRTIQFALIACVFTGWLGLDDAFLIHENILPKLGVSQELVIFVYVALALLYGYRAVTSKLKPDPVLFGASAICLAASVGLDVVLHSTNSLVVTAEDGFKFIGICAWFGFHANLMAAMVLDSVKQIPSSARPANAQIGNLNTELMR